VSLLALSALATSRWAGFYTRKLPESQRLDRIGEIESDLWEHSSHGRRSGVTEADIAFEILLRLVLGVPADLLWRRSVFARASGMRTAAGSLDLSKGALKMTKRVLVSFSNAVAVAGGLFLILNAFGSGLVGGSTGDVLFALVEVGCAVLLIGGVIYARRSPRTGTILLIAGATLAAGWHFWALWLFAPLALIVIVGAIAKLRTPGGPGISPA
jgi:hypothetical protein